MSEVHELLWAEKYRPKSLDEVVDQEEIVARLKVFVETRNMPHCLFAGPPGTGKCVTPETPVLTANGPVEIGRVAGKIQGLDSFKSSRGIIFTLNLDGRIEEGLYIKAYKGVANELVEIRTRSGRRVRVTPRHPLLVLRGRLPKWLLACRVRVGDRVAAPSYIPWPDGPVSSSGIVRAGNVNITDGIPVFLWKSKILLSRLLIAQLRRRGYVDGESVVIDVEESRGAEHLLYALSTFGIVGTLEERSRSAFPWRVRVKGFSKVDELIECIVVGGIKGGTCRRISNNELLVGGLRAATSLLAAVLKIMSVEELGRYRILNSPHLFWDEILEVNRLKGEFTVYDLTVPHTHNFIGGHGPLILHNTTMAHALAHDLYGPEYRRYFLELNASDARGIDVIRTTVKEFARSVVPGPVPFKIIVLDEADNMTADAQQALRRLMEMYTANTRFILIANYPSKIIEPIQSRTAFFRFTPLSEADVIARLKWIAEQEGVSVDINALKVIHALSEGDLRRAINILQAAAALGEVNAENVYKVVGAAHPREVREMLATALEGRFEEAREKLRTIMITYGLSGADIIKHIHREIFSGEINIPEELKILIADYAGEIQFRLVEGADDEIQLSAFLARLAIIGRKLRA